MGTVGSKKIIDKIENDVGYISFKKRLGRCFFLKIEVVMTLMVMMTMMLMMVVQNRENNSNYNERENNSEYNFEEYNTDDEDEEYYDDDDESEETDENYHNDYNRSTSRINEENNILFASIPMNDTFNYKINVFNDCNKNYKYQNIIFN